MTYPVHYLFCMSDLSSLLVAAENGVVSSLILWYPNKGGRGKLLYPDVIARDNNLERTDLETAMQGREYWNLKYIEVE